MSAETFKLWMQKMDMSVIDVASSLKISINTVNRFLRGERVNRSTKAALERLVATTRENESVAG